MPVTSLKDVKDDDEEDKKRQAYYAGGQGQNGGGSGQEVLDPREFMKRARDEMGAQTVGEYNDAQGPPPSSSFTGAGHTLAGESVQGATAPKPPEEHTITFYQNGFTVDDGPLRSPDDPANAAFLAAVNRGQMPAELMGEDGANQEGDVHIIDKSGEPYKPPPVTLKPFGGEGRSMREEGASSSASAAPAAEAAALTVDDAQPTTTLQVRLADGSKVRVKANQSHTILQLRQHISRRSRRRAWVLVRLPPSRPRRARRAASRRA